MDTRQEAQQRALEQAQKAPGVREVLQVYGQISYMTGTRIVQNEPALMYATGGNAR